MQDKIANSVVTVIPARNVAKVNVSAAVFIISLFFRTILLQPR